jgi:hypothetical protein
MQQDLVDLSLSNAFSIAKLDSISIKAKSNSAILIDLPTSQRKAMIHFYDSSSQNESSCASQLAARAKSQSEVQRHVKFIVELVSEGARNAPTIFQTFSSTVAFTSGAQSARASPLTVFANQTNATMKNSPKKRVHGRLINSHLHRLFFERHRLIVVFIAANESNHEGAWAQATSFQTSDKDEMCSASQLAANEHKGLFNNETAPTFWLIIRFKKQYQSKMQRDLVDFSSSKTISIAKLGTSRFAKPSDEANLVDRIFETSDAFNRRRLIVTFFKPNANIPSSNSKAEMHKAVSDSRERQPNDRIIDINPLLSLPFQEACMITPSLSRKFIVESLSEGA